MLENPTQNSAAAYTASWVSSTSSIPPELRDEPEVPSFNGSAHSGCRDDLAAGASAVFTPPVSTFADQFSNMSIIEKDGEVLNTSWEDCATLPSQQWPGLGQDGDGGGVPGGQGRRRKTEDRDRRGRESPKELTWEERIRKGAVQKERVEQRGLEKPEKTERDVREINLGSGRQRGQRGRPTNPDGCRIQRGGSARLPLLSPVPPIERENTQCRHGQAVRISAPRSNRLCERDGHFDAGPPRMVPMHAPQYYNHGAPLLMGRGAYYRPGPPVVCVPQQDQRFRNTWLDANLGLNYPQVQMVDYAFSPCCVFRARPNFGGRSGYRCTSRYANSARDSTRTQPHEGGVRETKVDEEEVWLCEAEEEKQNRCANNVDWSPGKEGPENGVPRGSTIIENREKGEDDEKEDRCKDNNIRSDILTPNDEADTLKTAASA
ncbi:hypothetical protein Q1695_000004 [Nippostrongylus brasiliensis]|nr:hypothetical protein Q1695_000004 [Nippostrongylus brasiliensis]